MAKENHPKFESEDGEFESQDGEPNQVTPEVWRAAHASWQADDPTGYAQAQKEWAELKATPEFQAHEAERDSMEAEEKAAKAPQHVQDVRSLIFSSFSERWPLEKFQNPDGAFKSAAEVRVLLLRDLTVRPGVKFLHQG